MLHSPLGLWIDQPPLSLSLVQVWIKPNGEMPFLYGNHVAKAHLGRITEDTPEHQGVVVFSMSDLPLVRFCSLPLHLALSTSHSRMILLLQGFGVTARSTMDTKKLDPTAILVYNQAYVLV